jgi:hypothetical protein
MTNNDLKAIKLALSILIEKEYQKEQDEINEQIKNIRFQTLKDRQDTIERASHDVDLKYRPLLKELKE